MIYAVAGTFTKRVSTGISIMCAIRKVEAASSDEAMGKFLRIMVTELPGHNIHVHPVYITMEDDLLEEVKEDEEHAASVQNDMENTCDG